ncbi:MAG: Fe-S cluster assembly ATPase SufC [Oscillospiraceae bacterium]|jgi:Fe-S cluster assembly ATP-binding protein|nr:Fe-S cluster assembly ATPase SufC [Oscillospiraceae bacterium]
MTKAPLLQIKNLTVAVGEKLILRDLELTINAGETHVLMGQNGTGKSTLASAIMGSPAFDIISGEILFEGENITEESPDKRARRGIFLSFQNPEEVPGVTLENFLRTAKGAVTGEKPRLMQFKKDLRVEMERLGVAETYAARELNVGFSGGEKKKAEILQLLTLNPKLAILDEADSGLDVDAVKTVSEGVSRFRNEGNALLIITHNTRLVEGIAVDRVHVLENKKLALSGGAELMRRITDSGFAGLQTNPDAPRGAPKGDTQ